MLRGPRICFWPTKLSNDVGLICSARGTRSFPRSFLPSFDVCKQKSFLIYESYKRRNYARRVDMYYKIIETCVYHLYDYINIFNYITITAVL